MEIKNENGFRILYAAEGCVLQCITDGLVVGTKVYLGKNDSEKHYRDKEIEEDELPPNLY